MFGWCHGVAWGGSALSMLPPSAVNKVGSPPSTATHPPGMLATTQGRVGAFSNKGQNNTGFTACMVLCASPLHHTCTQMSDISVTCHVVNNATLAMHFGPLLLRIMNCASKCRNVTLENRDEDAGHADSRCAASWQCQEATQYSDPGTGCLFYIFFAPYASSVFSVGRGRRPYSYRGHSGYRGYPLTHLWMFLADCMPLQSALRRAFCWHVS